MKKAKILPSLLATAIAVASMTFPILQVSAADVKTQYHTPSEIKEYYEEHPFDFYGKTEYASAPSAKSPYALGSLTDATQENALRSLNFVRYVAGLPEVSLNASCIEYAQAASLVSAANGVLTHLPSQPAGMSDALYQKCQQGARSTNISYRSSGSYLADILVRGYMDDSDAGNIKTVGHRRWCLNPNMSKTGFGCAGNYSAMYSHDQSRRGTEKCVCWPARNMPLEFFAPWRSESIPWSISIGKVLLEDLVKVTLTRRTDGRTWSFSSRGSDGEFYIDNAMYGATGCIIFRPDNVSYRSGEAYDVHIEYACTDNTYDTIDYSVSFFSLSEVYAETGGLTIGNVNYDKFVDAADASLVLTEYARLSTGLEGCFNSEQIRNGDVNSDGKINAVDASAILMYYSYASTTKNPVSMEQWRK